MINDMYSELEKTIGYTFRNSSLLYTAMLHRSGANEAGLKRIDSNERLEFLGDAVLELVSSNYLLTKYPDTPEGDLTKKRASMVCEVALSYCALEMGLEKYITLGKGEEKTGGRTRPSITSDALEALIGAIYIDGGFDNAKEFIHKFILEKQGDEVLFKDSKTALQEKVQTNKESTIVYKVINEIGPDHNKQYEVACLINNKTYESGIGSTKKAAEQKAAFNTIKKYFS